MKKQNKWTIPLIVAIVCAVAVFLMHPGKVAAANQAATLDPTTIDYLDPFDLTVQQLTVPQRTSTVSNSVSVQPSAVTTASAPAPVLMVMSGSPSGSPLKPLKIWMPFRPTFRSPCTPSW